MSKDRKKAIELRPGVTGDTTMDNFPVRMWINQPSTLQSLHHLHGTNVLAVHECDDTYRIYFLSGPIVSQQAPASALSPGWRAMSDRMSDALKLASKKLPFRASKAIEANLSCFCSSYAEAYMAGAEEAQGEIVARLRAELGKEAHREWMNASLGAPVETSARRQCGCRTPGCTGCGEFP